MAQRLAACRHGAEPKTKIPTETLERKHAVHLRVQQKAGPFELRKIKRHIKCLHDIDELGDDKSNDEESQYVSNIEGRKEEKYIKVAMISQ